ncbi:MAG: hypothetical protein JNG86_03975 [Verrucomicrobiaceae bacterium]|nr:hypothetical protein [Verrucomicrobiaceae bacterium]
MHKSLFALLPALLLVSCESPAPIIISNARPTPSYSSSSSSYTPPSTSATPVTRTTYAYPNIAGVWKSDNRTIRIGPSNGGPFTVTFIGDRARSNTVTATWGQPYHKHFKFTRVGGREGIATLDSLTPSKISIKEENGRVHDWRKVADL